MRSPRAGLESFQACVILGVSAFPSVFVVWWGGAQNVFPESHKAKSACASQFSCMSHVQAPLPLTSWKFLDLLNFAILVNSTVYFWYVRGSVFFLVTDEF